MRTPKSLPRKTPPHPFLRHSILPSSALALLKHPLCLLFSEPKMASYSSFCMAVACLVAALFNGAAATRQFTVGGSAGWVPPASGTMSYNDWAGKNRFLIGDTLVFKYNPSQDAVVRVSAEDYNSCSTSNPISSFKDGNTVFQFPSHGPFYFISGNSSNCNNGEKLIVVVLSPRNNTSHFSHSPAPAPAYASAPTAATPSPAPTTSAATPSPAPTTAAITPSPAPTTAATPSPAPTAATPSPAPTTVVSPAPAPTTVLAPSPAPTTVASPPSIATPVATPIVAPSTSPANSEPINTSPSPAPIVNPGGQTPSASATGPAVSYLVYAGITLVTVVLSGTSLNICN